MSQQEIYQNRWKAMIFICISLLVISIDNTILNVALPSISRDLGATSSDLQWILDAYILVFAALLLTMGSIGDRIGRKRILQFGLVLFGIGSLAAALSSTTEMLIGSRAFLGLGAAIIMPATLSIITATFPKEERSQAIAMWAAVFGLGIGIGPVLGGWLLESYEWNSVFYVNLPVIAIALLGGAIFIHESKDEHAPKADWIGVALSVPGLFALVYAIIEAGVDGWTADNVLIGFGAAGILLAAFAWWENRNPDAMLPISFFKNMSFTGANTTLALLMFGLFGSVFFLSQYLQTVIGFSALEAGIRIVPFAFMMAFSSVISAQVVKRLGTKRTVTLGVLILSAGLFYMSTYKVDSEYSYIVVGQLIVAFGLGLAVSPCTDSVMGSVPANKAGVGSAMNDTTRELGGALGVAVMGSIMNSHYISEVGSIEDKLPAPMYEAMAQGGAIAAIKDSIQAAHMVATDPRTPAFARDIIIGTADSAFVGGMTEAMTIGAVIMLFTAALAYFLLPNEVQPSTHGAVVDDEVDGVIPAVAVGD